MNNKWISISLGTLLGLSHIGMIGMISRQQKFPVVNVPVGPYTAYRVEASKEGYRIHYRANDPKVMRVERDIKKKAGFLGLGNNRESVIEQVPVDRSLRSQAQQQDPDARSEACIKAIGSGEGTGRIVGGSLGGAVATTGVASIPYVGWVLAGAATMMGMDAGSEIGGQMAEDLSKNC